jgi:hypothetical protein
MSCCTRPDVGKLALRRSVRAVFRQLAIQNLGNGILDCHDTMANRIALLLTLVPTLALCAQIVTRNGTIVLQGMSDLLIAAKERLWLL